MKSSEGAYWDDFAQRYTKIYTGKKSGLNRWADHLLRRNLSQRFKLTFRLLDDLSGKTVLDVGCGPGFYMMAALERGAEEAVGLDPSSRMLDTARRFLNAAFPDSTRWRLLQEGIEDSKLRGKFDVTLALGLFDYLNSPLGALKRIRRLTRETLVCSFPHPWAWRVLPRRVWLRTRGVKVNFYTRARIAKLMEKTGFSIVAFRRLGPIYWTASVPSAPS